METQNHRKVEISDNFWKEFKIRGFQLDQDGGGRFVKLGPTAGISKSPVGLFRLFGSKKYRITFIDGSLFFQTVKKIEKMLNYKLFY